MNIVDPILFHCRTQPEALAIAAPGMDMVTYSRLEAVANNIARRVQSEGFGPGDTVAILVHQPVVHAALIIALTRLGIISASLAMRQIPKGLSFDAVLTDGGPALAECRTLRMDSSWTMGDGHMPETDYVAKGTDACRIMLTSGTTGEAKGVVATHDMLIGRLLRYNTVYGSTVARASRVMCDVGWSTALRYQFFLYTLGRGGAFFVRGDTPANTLRALEFYRIDHLVSAPAGLAEIVDEYDKNQCRHVIDVVHAAGGTLSDVLLDRVRNRLGSRVIMDYGSAETSCVASAPVNLLEDTHGAVGVVTPGMTVEIVDENDRLAEAAQEGIVRIRGDYAASEYIGDADASSLAFRDGWFYPGDLGSLTADRILVISGRQSSVLNLGGEKINPEIVEVVLASFGEGLEAAVLAMDGPAGVEELWAVVASAQPLDESRLRDHCRTKLTEAFVPRRFVRVDRLPHNPMGKLDRTRILALLRPN